jgi:hypothetical protein
MLKKGTPISPDEVVETKVATIPPEVFDVWNALIAKKWASGGRATIMQSEIVKELCEVLKVERNKIFEMHWLDVEDAYRAQGWNVEYDRPGYCETYEASFIFTRGKK